MTEEWELRADEEVNFLECGVEDGQAHWTLTRAIGIDEIDGDIASAIIADGDPPETVRFEGDEYVGSTSDAGLYRKDGTEAEREFVNWSFEGEEGKVLFIQPVGRARLCCVRGLGSRRIPIHRHSAGGGGQLKWLGA